MNESQTIDMGRLFILSTGVVAKTRTDIDGVGVVSIFETGGRTIMDCFWIVARGTRFLI